MFLLRNINYNLLLFFFLKCNTRSGPMFISYAKSSKVSYMCWMSQFTNVSLNFAKVFL